MSRGPGALAGSMPDPEQAPGGVAARLRRLVPAGLAGPGRRPAWQRTRLRRVLSAGLVATSLWAAVSAFRPEPAPIRAPVVVVAQDLMAGHVLTRGDLAVADWPMGLSLGGAVADPESLVGRALGAAMSRGEPITTARVRGPGLLLGVRTGLVAAHIRLADPSMAAMASAGNHVDLISSAGRLVAADVVVLAVDAGSARSGWSAAPESGPPAGVIVAVTPAAALRLATADTSGLSDDTFSLVLRMPGM